MSNRNNSYRLFVTAEPDSNFLALIGDTLACLGLVPKCLHAKQEIAAAGPAMLAILLIQGTRRQMDLLERKFLRMPIVHRVEWEPTALAAEGG